MYGPLDSFAAWIYESHMTVLSRMINSGFKSHSQLYNRIYEKSLVDADRTSHHHDQTGKYRMIGYKRTTNDFKKIQIYGKGIFGADDRYNFCMTGNRTICSIQGRFKKTTTNNNTIITVKAKQYKTVTNFFTYPLDSSILSIFAVENDDNTCEFSLNIEEIKHKFVAFPYYTENQEEVDGVGTIILFPLLKNESA